MTDIRFLSRPKAIAFLQLNRVFLNRERTQAMGAAQDFGDLLLGRRHLFLGDGAGDDHAQPGLLAVPDLDGRLEIHLQVLRDNRALSRLFVIFLYNKQ